MTVLFDTNVVLDVLLDREPHNRASAAAWAAVENSRVESFVAAHAVTTIYYFLRKRLGADESRRALDAALSVFRIATVDGTIVKEALRLPISDFEDAVTAAAAHRAGCQFIVTRDLKGFGGSLVRHLPPEAIPDLINRE
jgi:predicted nucleic acid-binding protein